MLLCVHTAQRVKRCVAARERRVERSVEADHHSRLAETGSYANLDA